MAGGGARAVRCAVPPVSSAPLSGLASVGAQRVPQPARGLRHRGNRPLRADLRRVCLGARGLQPLCGAGPRGSGIPQQQSHRLLPRGMGRPPGPRGALRGGLRPAHSGNRRHGRTADRIAGGQYPVRHRTFLVSAPLDGTHRAHRGSRHDRCLDAPDRAQAGTRGPGSQPGASDPDPLAGVDRRPGSRGAGESGQRPDGV